MSVTVTRHKNLTPDVFELAYRVDSPEKFLAGQWISVVVPDPAHPGKELRRPYSIATPPEQDEIELCVQLVPTGPGSNYLNRMRPGDKFTCHAYYGNFVYKPKPNRDVVFVATGTGVAPFRSMILSSQFQANLPRSVTLLMGVRNREDVFYREELSQFSWLRWISCLSREEQVLPGEFKGRVTHWLSQERELNWLETDFYVCGNGGMIDEVKHFLREGKGVDRKSFHHEAYFK